MATELDEVLTRTRVSADQGQVHVHTKRCFCCHNSALSLSFRQTGAFAVTRVEIEWNHKHTKQTHHPWWQTSSSSIEVIFSCSSGV